MMAKTGHDRELGETEQEKESKDRLRAELKTWERAFEKQNGHKPGPADVKANAEISAKYKTYHKAFRTKSLGKEKTKTEYESTANALKRITPQKRQRDDVLTPVKGVQVGDDVESVGPTPQLNGRMLGLFDGIKDQTPLGKHRKLTWGERLAEARKDSPKKTPRKRTLSDQTLPDSLFQETPTKSISSVRSRLTTPTTQPPSLYNQHAFATPAFLRPTAQPVESPQSPSLPWERFPGKVKGLSALISDFRQNQQERVPEMDYEAWEDEDELKITQENNSPGVAGRKPWVKKGAKRSKRRVIMRPVPKMEVPPSDDETSDNAPDSPTTQRRQSRELGRDSPELNGVDEGPFQDEEEPSDLEDAKAKAVITTVAPAKKPRKQAATKTAKGGYKIGKQVSGNFVSYKIRGKGGRGRGRFGGGRFGRR